MSPEIKKYEFSPEEQEAIKSRFLEWEWLLEQSGARPTDIHEDIDRSYEDSLDRDLDQGSYFNYQKLDVVKLRNPLEDYMFRPDEPKPIKTRRGEIWICISLLPKDIYLPKIGKYERAFFAEQHNVYLSSKGRGFEDTEYRRVKMDCLRIERFTESSYPVEALHDYVEEEKIEALKPVSTDTLKKFQGLLEEIQANP